MPQDSNVPGVIERLVEDVRQNHRTQCAFVFLLHAFSSHANYLRGALDEMREEDWRNLRSSHDHLLQVVRQLTIRLEQIEFPIPLPDAATEVEPGSFTQRAS